MKASEQLARWIHDDNHLYGTPQDEILRLVFQYPPVAAYKLVLAKWQFLHQGAVEEGLWQQLLLQWPNPAQLFEWRNKSFDFRNSVDNKTFENQETGQAIADKIPSVSQPVLTVWDWVQFLDKMQAPVSFVWELPKETEVAVIEDLPVFEYLLTTESENEKASHIETVPASEDQSVIDGLKTQNITIDWGSYISNHLEHMFSVGIAESFNQIDEKNISEDSFIIRASLQSDEKVQIVAEELPVESELQVNMKSNDPPKEINFSMHHKDMYPAQTEGRYSTESFHPSAFVQWLQSKKRLEVPGDMQVLEANMKEEVEKNDDEKDFINSKTEKEKYKEKNKEKSKSKKKVKKKKKLKKKDKLVEEIYSSLEFRDDVASETYAALLAKQGHFELSERIYERLRLIYPEKSSYFAGLIKKLKS